MNLETPSLTTSNKGKENTFHSIARPKNRKKHQSKHFTSDLIKACESLLNTRVLDLEFPGGRSRKSCRMKLEDGRSVIATVRSRSSRAATESKVLKTIAAKCQCVPHLLASDEHRLLLQEDLPGKRLSTELYTADDLLLESLLDQALTSLNTIQTTGSDYGLDECSRKIGRTRKWLTAFIDRPAVIGAYLKIPAPRPDLKKLHNMLAVRKKNRFIKWDARPGNAVVGSNKQVRWFDWEHSGSRNRLDDVAWLLGDEFVPDNANIESRLIEKHLSEFSDGLSMDQVREYLYAFGVFHSLVRLGLMLQHKKGGDWWDIEKCISGDKVGVTRECAKRVCLRSARWAINTPATAPLAPWLMEIPEMIDLM